MVKHNETKIGRNKESASGFQKTCEYCNKPFIAQKMTTRYCSHACNSKAYKAGKKEEARKQFNMVAINYSTMQEIERQSETFEKIKDKDYLSVSETAFLLSVGRATIYRYLHSGVLKAFQTNGKTFIRKTDIDAMFDDSGQYKAKPNKEKKPITEFYTVKEIKEKFSVKETWIFKIVKENNVPKTLIKGKSYFSKKHIDRYFEKKGFGNTQNIEEWYTVKEIQNKYDLSLPAIYSFVSENNIPRKKEGRKVFYSKKHFDLAKGYLTPEYYTVEEAMKKYNLTRDSLYYHVKFHNIPKVQEGKFIKISKEELDKLFDNKIII
jgi:excisionase family DNA binding protein